VGDGRQRQVGLGHQLLDPLHAHPQDLLVRRAAQPLLEAALQHAPRQGHGAQNVFDAYAFRGVGADEADDCGEVAVGGGQHIRRLPGGDAQRLDQVGHRLHPLTGHHRVQQPRRLVALDNQRSSMAPGSASGARRRLEYRDDRGQRPRERSRGEDAD
jgi:hypothetical protein